MASESLDLASIAQLQQMDKNERDKKTEAKRTMVQNSKAFDSEQRKQRNEDRKHEFDVRKLEEETRQKELDREQRQRLEEARLRSAEREGAASRASQEGIARAGRILQATEGLNTRVHQMGTLLLSQAHDMNMERTRNTNALGLEAVRYGNERALENVRHNHAMALGNQKHKNDVKLQNLGQNNALQMENKRETHDTNIEKGKAQVQIDLAKNEQAFRKALEEAKAKAEEEKRALEASQKSREWNAERADEAINHMFNLTRDVNDHYLDIVTDPNLSDAQRNRAILNMIGTVRGMADSPYQLNVRDAEGKLWDYRKLSGQINDEGMPVDTDSNPLVLNNLHFEFTPNPAFFRQNVINDKGEIVRTTAPDYANPSASHPLTVTKPGGKWQAPDTNGTYEGQYELTHKPGVVSNTISSVPVPASPTNPF